jgi:hypothetical protein
LEKKSEHGGGNESTEIKKKKHGGRNGSTEIKKKTRHREKKENK